ncbi:MAG: family 20 glycosylhydrolase, partial [Gammaproteobacteria bacterium]|nr:family 20 glycosylhydrolase [Gammaproteobacteria bacterium]
MVFALPPPPSTASQPDKESILFVVDADAAVGSPEGYDLDINAKSIRVAANDPRGLLYGAVTLWQLLSAGPGKQKEVSVAALRIKDAPRLKWRGLMLDSAHRFQSVDFIKRFIDQMAAHKLNLLHWRLA